MTPTVLITATTISQAAIDYLDRAGCKLLFLSSDDKQTELEQLARTQHVDAILSRTYKISQELITHCPSLKVIARHGIGYDNVDINAASEHGIPVLVTPGTNAYGVAELCIGLLLACARQIPQGNTAIRQGLWPRAHHGKELYGKTLGLVGLGRIAQHVAQVATALGMRVLAHDPFITQSPYTLTATLDELLAQSDVVSLHCPAQNNGKPLFTSSTFARMKPDSILINTARGQLIDEVALAEAITSGQLYAAGLDTLATEPPANNHPFFQLDRIVLSPHLGGSTDQSLERTAMMAAQNLLDYLKNKTINEATLVNPQYKQGATIR